MDNIVFTIDDQKSQRCYPPHGTMKKKCNLWLSLCYLPLGNLAIFAEYQTSVSKRSCFSLGSGLGLGPWSCHLLHGNKEEWIRIFFTIDYQKSQRCYAPLGTMKKKCNLWLSLCYLPLGSQAILPNVTLRCPNGSCFSLGLGIGPRSCHLLHGNNERWITLSLP